MFSGDGVESGVSTGGDPSESGKGRLRRVGVLCKQRPPPAFLAQGQSHPQTFARLSSFPPPPLSPSNHPSSALSRTAHRPFVDAPAPASSGPLCKPPTAKLPRHTANPNTVMSKNAAEPVDEPVYVEGDEEEEESDEYEDIEVRTLFESPSFRSFRLRDAVTSRKKGSTGDDRLRLPHRMTTKKVRERKQTTRARKTQREKRCAYMQHITGFRPRLGGQLQDARY